MNVNKINHLGIAVRDLQAAAQVYEAMGLHIEKVIEVPEQQVRVAFIPIGESTIELVQPTTSDGPVAKYLDKRGEGLHHLAVEVDDLVAALADLQNQGIQLIDKTPRQGAEGQVAFVHPKSTGKVLIELVQPKKE